MIGHHDISVKRIILHLFFTVANRIDDQRGNIRPAQVEWAIARTIENRIHDGKSFTRRRIGGEDAIPWQATAQAPRDENGAVDLVKVRQMAFRVCSHTEEWLENGKISASAARGPIGNRAAGCNPAPHLRDTLRFAYGYQQGTA